MELVKFDTQALQNPEISGVEYQQGELLGYEIREYLLEKWERKCAYCGKTGVALEVEHINPKSRGGSNRVSNLTLACYTCNQQKGNQTALEFGYPMIQSKAKEPLNTVSVMNGIRWALLELLKTTGLPLEVGTGGQTKFNRSKQDYPKTHWIDAACVGNSGESVHIYPNHKPLLITAKGRQRRQMTLPDKFGFPRTKAKYSTSYGFKTGDVIKAVVPKGKKQGTYLGRVAVRVSGRFDISTNSKLVEGISYRYCQIIQHSDGYTYAI
jgi:hypothetical protein